MLKKLAIIFFTFVTCFSLIFYYSNPVRQLADIYEEAEKTVAKKQKEEEENYILQQKSLKKTTVPFWKKISLFDWTIIALLVVLASLMIWLFIKYF